MSRDKKIRNLIEEIIKDCMKNNCAVQLNPKVVLEDNVAGYFSSEGGLEIHIAAQSEDWWETLAHEYIHFLQWREGKFMSGPEWSKCNYADPWQIQEIRVSNGYVSQEELDGAYDVILACEADCIERTLELMQKHGLITSSKNEEDYIKRGNLYLYLLALEKDLGKIKNENKYWNSYKILKIIPNRFHFDHKNPEKFKVPEKVRDFIINEESMHLRNRARNIEGKNK